jgi:5'-deoxynucleotidase
MNPFYAYLSRLKLIRRWGLMRNTVPENDMEHSMQCALIAHGLAVIAKERHARDVNPETVLCLALYHDVGEVLTGDLPTPIKYKNPEIKSAYKRIEAMANQQLLEMLPGDLRASYHPYLLPDETAYEWKLVKAADRICAYVKCVEEQNLGNREFEQARASVLESIRRSDLPEVSEFMREFVPSFELSLDQLSKL